MGGERQISLLVVTKLKDGSALMTNIAILRLRGHCIVLPSQCSGRGTPGITLLHPLRDSVCLSPSVRLGLNQENLLSFNITRERFLSDRVAEEGGN